MERIATIVLCVVVGFVSACSGSGMAPEPAENRTGVFEPDAPNFDMEAVAVLRGDSVGVNVYSAIPKTSLVYVERGEDYVAAYDLLFRVYDRGGDVAALETVVSDTVAEASFDATHETVQIHRSDFLPLDPGAYTVELVLEDLESGLTAHRRQDVELPDAAAGESVLSDVRLSVSRNAGPFEPAVANHLPGAYDSLRAVADLYNLDEQVEARLTLVRFASDTSAATPPFFFTPGAFSMAYIGVDNERGDTLQVSRRRLTGGGEPIRIEFSLPVLDRGTYAVELSVSSAAASHVSRRHFIVMRPSFPAISSLDEMIDALQYIARESEWKRIVEASSPEERRREFDAFWAGLVPNREAAAQLLQTYYSRVEEANLLYSNHKEGWKTDFGMIYIVFGSPAYTETHHIRDIWYYFDQGATLSRRLPPFIFRRSRTYGFAGIFQHYILQRDSGHEYEWRLRVEKWRDGVAM